VPGKRTRSSPTKPDLYLDFVRTVHLAGLGLDRADMCLKRDLLASARSGDENTNNELTADHKILLHEDDRFIIEGNYKLFIKTASDVSVVEIGCSFSALFETTSRADPEFIKRFADNEARLVFWPYLRHFISDSTYRMSINPITIPLTSELFPVAKKIDSEQAKKRSKR
jgi:preprotein translocase subunit SecB